MTYTIKRPLTKEEKSAQIAQKREQLFQGILFTLLQNVQVIQTDLSQFVDASLAAADYALKKLYPIPQEGDEK